MRRRRYLMHAFKEMGLHCFEPFGAFYVFPCIKEFGMTSEEFAMRLLREEKVAVVPGYRIWRERGRIPADFLCLFPGRSEDRPGKTGSALLRNAVEEEQKHE